MTVPQRPGTRIIMVKKILANGEPCAKCKQAEEMLRRRGLFEQIDAVIYADERTEGSEGSVIAKRHGVTLAPFFLVIDEAGHETVVESAIKLAKDHLAKVSPKAPSAEGGGALTRDEVEAAAIELSEQTPQKVLSWMLDRLGERTAIAFSGAEDVALIDMAVQLGKPFSVFCLDTGRLHTETHEFIERVRAHYGITIHLVSPEPAPVERLVREKGLFSFYSDGHQECCGVRKIEPLRRVLSGFDGWITGQRRDQSPTRSDVSTLMWDEGHGRGGFVKANPLAGWTLDKVWKYLRANNVPTNTLHEQGFVSIGCAPCTRAPRPGEHERAGRWWWEEATQRECGLHK